MKNRLLRHTTALLLSIVLFAVLLVPVRASYAILGDANLDYELTSADARIALRLAVGLEELTPDLLKLCDVDKNGRVTSADARSILRAAVLLESFYGEMVLIDGKADGSGQGTYVPEPTTQPPEPVVPVTPVPTPSVPEIPGGSGTTPVFTPQRGAFTVISVGNGHGVGMTQHGAAYLAKQGWNYQQILAYYYHQSVLVMAGLDSTTCFYLDGYYDVETLLCAMVYQEIGGITQDIEALKAQAVAIYTLMKRSNFYITGAYDVAATGGRNYRTTDAISAAVHDVLGQYVAEAGDPYLNPALTVYSSMSGGRTLSAEQVWGYPTFPYEGTYSLFDGDPSVQVSWESFVRVLTLSVEEVRADILRKNPGTVLSENPAEWITILQHDAAYNADIGDVQAIRLGDQVYYGITPCNFLGLRSPCYTIFYTP